MTSRPMPPVAESTLGVRSDFPIFSRRFDGRGGRALIYDNPHDHPGHVSPQELLPEGVVGERFYEPGDAEAELVRRLAQIRGMRGR